MTTNQDEILSLIKAENERQLVSACKNGTNASDVIGRVILNEIEEGKDDNKFHLDEIMEWEVYADFIKDKTLPNEPLSGVMIIMKYEDGSFIYLTTNAEGKAAFKPLKLGKVVYSLPGIINDTHIMSFNIIK